MEFREPKTKKGSIQLMRYTPHATPRQTYVGTFVPSQPIPAELWEKLTQDERAELVTWQAERLRAIATEELTEFARSLPENLSRLAEAWPVIAEKIGNSADDLAAATVKALPRLRKALKQ